MLTLILLQIVCGELKYDTIYILTVDGVHFRTFESHKNPSAKVCSRKFNGPALAYEIAIAIHESRLLSINGPSDASKHDITMFREKMMEDIPVGKRGIGDSGYHQTRLVITVKDTLKI